MIDGHVGGSQENATDCLIVDMSQGRPGAVYPRMCGVDPQGGQMDALITGLSRVCGVDATIGLLLERTAGLSPRVRGRFLHFVGHCEYLLKVGRYWITS